jgi:oligoribonuclease (3'-5' exoribonuclease)
MCGKQPINIWLAFRILGLEMNFDNIISVTCICVGMLEIVSLHLDIKMVGHVARLNNMKTVFAEFLSNSTFL